MGARLVFSIIPWHGETYHTAKGSLVTNCHDGLSVPRPLVYSRFTNLVADELHTEVLLGAAEIVGLTERAQIRFVVGTSPAAGVFVVDLEPGPCPTPGAIGTFKFALIAPLASTRSLTAAGTERDR